MRDRCFADRLGSGFMRSMHGEMSYDQGRTGLQRVLIIVGAAILLAVVPFLSGLLGALMLFVVVRRAHSWLGRRVPPRIAALFICVTVLLVLLIPGAWLLSTIVAEGVAALRSLEIGSSLPRVIQTPVGNFDLGATMATLASTLLTWISGRAVAFFGGATLSVLNLLVALFGLYYLLVDGDTLWRRVARIAPGPEGTAEVLAARFVSVTEALLLGTGLTAVLQGTVVGAAFAAVGLHPAMLWGFVTACVSVLPLLGSALVWLPGVGVLVLNHRTGPAIALFVVGAVVASNIDNVARLFAFRRVSGIHPMLTLVGAFAGIRVFGPIGAFLGPLILSYFLELVRIYDTVQKNGSLSAETRPALSPRMSAESATARGP